MKEAPTGASTDIWASNTVKGGVIVVYLGLSAWLEASVHGCLVPVTSAECASWALGGHCQYGLPLMP